MHRPPWTILLVVALVAVVRLIAHGQSSTNSQPQFEVASIKLNRSESPANYWEISGRRFLGNRSQVSELIRLAWGDFQLRIEGAPDWIGRGPIRCHRDRGCGHRTGRAGAWADDA